MKLVNLAGNPVTKTEVTADVLKYTGKTLLWSFGIYAVFAILVGVARKAEERNTPHSPK